MIIKCYNERRPVSIFFIIYTFKHTVTYIHIYWRLSFPFLN
jgi:hypothetical protein